MSPRRGRPVTCPSFGRSDGDACATCAGHLDEEECIQRVESSRMAAADAGTRMGRPRTTGRRSAGSVGITVRLSAAEARDLDSARGGTPRSAVATAALLAWIARDLRAPKES